MRTGIGGFRIASINTDVTGFRKRCYNERRRRSAIKLLKKAKDKKIDCLCLPAGYLVAKNEKEILKIIRPILNQAKKLKLSFVIGVDTSAILRYPDDPNSNTMLNAIRRGRVPCFLCAYSAQLDRLEIHRQRSCTSTQARKKILPDSSVTDTRFMPLGKIGFQIILCGEIYEDRLFGKDRPKAAVVFGHTTMPRLTRTLTSKSKKGFSIINTEHRTGRNGRLFCFDKGRDKSVISKSCSELDDNEDGPWFDMAIWELNEDGRFKPIL